MISGVPRAYDIFSNPQYLHFREHNQVFHDVAAFSSTQFQVLIRNAESSGMPAETIQGKLVSGTYFSVLGTQAAVGRLLSQADDRFPSALHHSGFPLFCCRVRNSFRVSSDRTAL
jgi:hypothetical protein